MVCLIYPQFPLTELGTQVYIVQAYAEGGLISEWRMSLYFDTIGVALFADKFSNWSFESPINS